MLFTAISYILWITANMFLENWSQSEKQSEIIGNELQAGAELGQAHQSLILLPIS